MRFLITVLLIALAAGANARKRPMYYDYFNTDAFWQRLKLEPAGPMPALAADDTCILVATNRGDGANALRFMSDDRGNGTLRFYLVYSSNARWHVMPCTGLRDGMLFMERRRSTAWVVYTEGMGKIFTTDLDRGMRVSGQYGVNVLLLDYPSIHTGYGSFKNYRFAWNNSTSIYRDFAGLFDSLRTIRHEELNKHGITLFFHSMGNNLFRKLVQKGSLKADGNARWVDNVVLNAPCTPRRGSRKWLEQQGVGDEVYVNYNPEDRVLKLASIAGFRGILGLGPKNKISPEARYINFRAVCGTSHSNFVGLYARPFPPREAIAYYNDLLHGYHANLADTTRFIPDLRRPNTYMLR